MLKSGEHGLEIHAESQVRSETSLEVERLRKQLAAIALERDAWQKVATEDLDSLKVKCVALLENSNECIAENKKLSEQLETERMRLVACSVAALGCFTDCVEEYKSVSLSDVLKLRALVEWHEKRSRHVAIILKRDGFILPYELADFDAQHPKPAT